MRTHNVSKMLARRIYEFVHAYHRLLVITSQAVWDVPATKQGVLVLG